MDLTRKNFILSIAADAIHACSGTNLFPSVLIAQACLEGNNGVSVLAKDYNNHFGIKASAAWTGNTIMMKTYEYINGIKKSVMAPFRAYSTLYDGFKDRCQFLIENPRYSVAGVFAASTPEAQIRAIKKSGYATDPNYENLLLGILKTYNLKQYDTQAVLEKKK